MISGGLKPRPTGASGLASAKLYINADVISSVEFPLIDFAFIYSANGAD